MAKLTKNKKQTNIESNIKEAFLIIDGFLPKHYTGEVQELVPQFSKTHIRRVKCLRKGPSIIIAALKKVAEAEKNLFE